MSKIEGKWASQWLKVSRKFLEPKLEPALELNFVFGSEAQVQTEVLEWTSATPSPMFLPEAVLFNPWHTCTEFVEFCELNLKV